MKIPLFPIAGAILNIFFFGLSNILVGHIFFGLWKLIFQFWVFPPLTSMIFNPLFEDADTRGAGYVFLTGISIIYIVLVAMDGYKTFQLIGKKWDEVVNHRP